MFNIKKLIWLILFFSLANYILADPYLVCTLRNESCSIGELDVLHMSNITTAHAELSNNSFYSYHVCCIDNSSTNTLTISYNSGEAGIISLAQETNSNVEYYSYSNYPIDVYLNTSVTPLSCLYTQSSCSIYNSTCLFSFSSDTNAHVSQCGSSPNNVCCGFNIVSESTAIPEISDYALMVVIGCLIGIIVYRRNNII